MRVDLRRQQLMAWPVIAELESQSKAGISDFSIYTYFPAQGGARRRLTRAERVRPGIFLTTAILPLHFASNYMRVAKWSAIAIATAGFGYEGPESLRLFLGK